MKEEPQWSEQDEIAELEKIYAAREEPPAAPPRRARLRTAVRRVWWTLWCVAMLVVSWKLMKLVWF